MNVWSINKHSEIKLLLITLQTEIGLEKFCIDDEVESGFSAVTLVKPGQADVRAYIYVFGQPIGKYGIHLEYPRLVEQNNYDSTLIYEELSLNLVIESLVAHFEIDAYGHVN